MSRVPARFEDQHADLAFTQVLHLFRRDEAVGDGLRPDAVEIQTATVVGDLDDDLTAPVERSKPQRSRFIPAGGDPRLRLLDAVVGAMIR